jgi:CheY-like chemotaxis protein
MGDAGRLQQVIWNLLSNAVKFTPEGGRVEVRLERVEWEQGSASAGESTHSPQPPSPSASQPLYAQITVTDTGKGITPEFLPYIFDRFRQADSKTTRQFGGLGLGLAIARHLLELHGGTIEVSSPGEGLGATFTVRLPLWRSEANEERGRSGEVLPSPPAPQPPLTNLRILVVDDETDARELLGFILERAGAIVTSVTSAAEALQTLTDSEVDVLISDIGMPDMDGYVLMQQITSRFAQGAGSLSANRVRPKAIALTAYAGEINQQKALAAGFQMHLSKPVEPENLINAIVTLLDVREVKANK